MTEDNDQKTNIMAFLERPKLINRSRSHTFKLEGGCWDCSNTTFRYFLSVWGKKYYQCEKCRAINH